MKTSTSISSDKISTGMEASWNGLKKFKVDEASGSSTFSAEMGKSQNTTVSSSWARSVGTDIDSGFIE